MLADSGTIQALVVGLFLFITVLVFLAKTVKIVPQAHAGIVERLGRYKRTLNPGLAIIIPFIDRVRPLIDQREQVVSFPPQPVITQDNLVVNIDSVIYFQVTDPKDASYEIADYIIGVEQLTVTTLRNVVGGMDLERTLTSREEINAALRGVLDEATGRWGIRVNRVELKAVDPPASIKDSMEKQMRAERDKRAAILNAEGNKQAAILNAEGNKTAAVLNAEGDARAQVLRAEAEARGPEGRSSNERRGTPVARDCAMTRSSSSRIVQRWKSHDNNQDHPAAAGDSQRGKRWPAARRASFCYRECGAWPTKKSFLNAIVWSV